MTGTPPPGISLERREYTVGDRTYHNQLHGAGDDWTDPSHTGCWTMERPPDDVELAAYAQAHAVAESVCEPVSLGDVLAAAMPQVRPVLASWHRDTIREGEGRLADGTLNHEQRGVVERRLAVLRDELAAAEAAYGPAGG